MNVPLTSDIFSFTLISCVNVPSTRDNRTRGQQTIDHYSIIIYEHTTMLIIRGTLNLPYNVSKQDQNDICPKNRSLAYNQIKLNTILMQFLNKMLL